MSIKGNRISKRREPKKKKTPLEITRSQNGKVNVTIGRLRKEAEPLKEVINHKQATIEERNREIGFLNRTAVQLDTMRTRVTETAQNFADALATHQKNSEKSLSAAKAEVAELSNVRIAFGRTLLKEVGTDVDRAFKLVSNESSSETEKVILGHLGQIVAKDYTW